MNASGQNIITLLEKGQTYASTGRDIVWVDDNNRSLSFATIANPTYKMDTLLRSSASAIKNRWTKFTIVNKAGTDQEYFIQLPKTGLISAWIKADNGNWQQQNAGSLLPLNARQLKSNTNGIVVQLLKQQPTQVILYLQSIYSIYQQREVVLQLQTVSDFERHDSKRLLWQGIFLGTILVMGLYNLILFFAVKDISYLYFVLSLIGIGLYFSFYYGIGMEYLWPDAPLWDTYAFMLIVPFNGLTRILFTKTYLHTSKLLPRTNIFLNVLAIICGGFIVMGLTIYVFAIDLLKPMVSVIGILGTCVLIMMLISGLISYYKDGYQPAKYFIVANVLLVIGGVIFIIREMGFFPDNFFTRYFVQIGTLIQVIMFALGLASRLNNTRLQLAEQIVEKERLALEKEIEKKELIEKQKEDLQSQVQQQTLDLKTQNQHLEDIISKLKTSELKLTQLNQLKDKLFSIISHDLRNPLATMQSTLKLITEHHNKLDEEEKKKLTAEAQASLDNLNLLLFNLLQWSRSQMNLLQYKKVPILLNELLHNCAKVMRLNAHMKNIRIHINCNSQLSFEGDKEMIEFVIRNLLSNAIKFSHRESDVYIKATTTHDGVKIQVLDSGIGLKPAQIQKLLLLNGAVTQRGTEKEKGTGLGLLISKEFIEKNAGTLSIESEPGKGSTFSILFRTKPTYFPIQNLLKI